MIDRILLSARFLILIAILNVWNNDVVNYLNTKFRMIYSYLRNWAHTYVGNENWREIEYKHIYIQ